ncbi:MAG: hypothetical protein EHM91_08115, partial [Planctomycetota bacterium]
MANMDKLILWGAAVVMAAVGSLSVWKISHEPAIDPEIAALAVDYEKRWSVRGGRGPEQAVPRPRIDFTSVVKEPE